MRYPDLEMVTLLGAARAARELERNTGVTVSGSLATLAASRALTLVEIILDQEDRLTDFHEHWRRWRHARIS